MNASLSLSCWLIAILFLLHLSCSAGRGSGGRSFAYLNETCKAAFFPADISLISRGSGSLRAVHVPMKLQFGYMDGTEVRALRPLQVTQKTICLRTGVSFLFNPLPGQILTICRTGLVQLSEPSLVVVSAHEEGCAGRIAKDRAASLALAPLAEPAQQPTSSPTCPEEPSSRPTSMPTLAMNASSSNSSSSSAQSLFASDTFIGSITAAGGAGVVTAASASYYLLRTAKAFVKVPMAPSSLAMQI